ncbi:MAG: phosphatidylserine decarboxylase family protein [Saprospiraceae bacterium]|nr:phosphatidylserine decarboxylase family protein [Saprospiraceae bacterium]
MIRIHREGYAVLLFSLFFLILMGVILRVRVAGPVFVLYILCALVLYGLVLQFFRNPERALPRRDNRLVYAPADGVVCAIEAVDEPEYFQDKRLLVSIFMSPLNVHVNRNPVEGDVVYVQYHAGKYLTAWHPKSSTENERTTVVYRTVHGEVLLRQIAGAVARRIRCYVHAGDRAEQGEEMGFIKFGSRVDLYLPLHVELKVKLNDVVKGKTDVIAAFTT